MMKGTVFTALIGRVEAPALAGRVLLAAGAGRDPRLLVQLLRQTGLEVDIVDNGQAAVEAALATDYGLLLMDLHMPGMDGPAATALLRAAGCCTPVVALADDVAELALQRCRDAGCVDVLAGPLERRHVHAVLAQHLRRPRAALSADAEMALALEELLAEFRRELPARLTEIEAALQGGELESMARLVHTLKGSAGSYGHPELTQLCAGIEAALRAGDAAALRQRCDVLHAAAAQALPLSA